ncbi:cyclin-dependent kinase inhibitor 7-like isoform X2 [Salvia splendens]|uniref:cyclin-dependent kinase inhibitor 7-like isoform X2 n=1 Tax=Salvia splendens TaxID=180675 RepID=UPI001C264C93|nr:cyclin-dependent kinase inhibitor 7-like isoform X2 [Salvia splendens]
MQNCHRLQIWRLGGPEGRFPPALILVVVKEKLKSVAKTPSAAELDDFFTEAEEYVQKRFAQKYNYDIVKDAPIQGGRYQWVPNPT